MHSSHGLERDLAIIALQKKRKGGKVFLSLLAEEILGQPDSCLIIDMRIVFFSGGFATNVREQNQRGILAPIQVGISRDF